MLATEIREFFYMLIKVSTPSVFPDNIGVKFNSLTMINEDEEEEVVISKRRINTKIERTTDGFRIKLYILNEGEEIKERIDYLFDEDYEIQNIDLDIYKKDNPSFKYTDYTIVDTVGEQLELEVPVEVSEECSNCLEYLTNGGIDIEDASLPNVFYDIVKDDKNLIDKINQIAELPI